MSLVEAITVFGFPFRHIHICKGTGRDMVDLEAMPGYWAGDLIGSVWRWTISLPIATHKSNHVSLVGDVYSPMDANHRTHTMIR